MRFALLLPAGCAVLFAATSPATMALLVILAGLPIAPLIASRNQLVERVAPRGTATEAFTWPLTALVAGVVARRGDGGLARRGLLLERRACSPPWRCRRSAPRAARAPGHAERAAARRLT